MMMRANLLKDSPTFASTPNSAVRGRKTYRNDVTPISPITGESDNRIDYINYSSAEDTCDSDIEEESPNKKEKSDKTDSTVDETANNTLSSSTMPVAVGICILGLLVIAVKIHAGYNNPCGLRSLKYNYRLEENFWYAIESSVNDIIQQDKPSVLVLLYNSLDRPQLEIFLKEFSNYSKCSLDKNGPHLIIKGKNLNTAENLASFGNVITNYKPKLEETGVMIVTDIDEVDSYVAQAFHTFCDEYTPLVKHSLIMFTLRYDDLKIKDPVIAQKILRNKWHNLKDDILEPLLTRVVGMVVKFHLL